MLVMAGSNINETRKSRETYPILHLLVARKPGCTEGEICIFHQYSTDAHGGELFDLQLLARVYQ